MDAFLQDPATWTGVGLLIFLAAVVFVMKAPQMVTKGLDDRAAKIRSELDTAAALRKEAEAKLADAERRQSEAEASAKEIVESARREAAQFAADASASLAERIKLREKLAEERISRAESEAVRDVRFAAVETASKAAAAILTEQLTGKAADDHFAASLEAVRKALS
jgi:F-type H+-transporting ATPase subunit b